MPAQHGAGYHQAVHPQRLRQEADERGEQRAVRPVWPGLRTGTAQHRDLLPQYQQYQQYQQLDVLGRR